MFISGSTVGTKEKDCAREKVDSKEWSEKESLQGKEEMGSELINCLHFLVSTIFKP